MFGEHVVELPDEVPRQLVLVGLLGNDRLPRPAEFIDEAGEGKDERLAEQGRLRAELPEEQVLGDAGGLGDLTRGGAAVVLAGEEVAGGVEQEPPWLATGAARRPGRLPATTFLFVESRWGTVIRSSSRRPGGR